MGNRPDGVERRLDRDFEREPSLGSRPRIPLNERGAVRVKIENQYRWLLTYQTAVISRWPTEAGAWVAHDRAVLQGLNPDALAVVESKEAA